MHVMSKRGNDIKAYSCRNNYSRRIPQKKDYIITSKKLPEYEKRHDEVKDGPAVDNLRYESTCNPYSIDLL